ncbi:bifunctional deaminase-reductase domain protein [Kribbella flavida DSM 17836]|uniref:Bifunctional deaminase-reductase domain protein n=1 Tax=Kribbella flavida (strain DSM 17836 / JCM 10339 / NBRC 14399) TaxID=479435 RepID=D2PWY7_KRIFD|nr:dihydrofolate reductase family protein [Kribbella flavida]ADB35367.1 bifunctional deaminase-reductase domain protein [Kribbella flavida DSM 17836]
MSFHAAVFIAVSLDGFIARPDGSIDWLTERGEQAGDTGYDEFMATVDTVVLGRNTYEKVLTFGFWPYDGKQVEVLSSTLPADTDERVIVHRTLDGLVETLNDRGAQRVYADGGRVVQTFLRAGLLNELTITTVPVLLGAGIPLFGELDRDIALTHNATRTLKAGFVQSDYSIPR